jgi:hypothetical protein
MANFIQNVEIMCKSNCKTQWKSYANLSAKLTRLVSCVKNTTFLPVFPTLFTPLFTKILPLSPPRLFHFFHRLYYNYN